MRKILATLVLMAPMVMSVTACEQDEQFYGEEEAVEE